MLHSRENISDLSEKILKGVQKAVSELIQANAAKGEDMVIGDPDGSFTIVPARELLEQRLPKKDC